MASSGFPSCQRHDFTKIYAISGGPGKPIHTRQRFDEVRMQYIALLQEGSAHITDLFGTKTVFTLHRTPKKSYLICEQDGEKEFLRLGAKDSIHIDIHSIMDLANKDCVVALENPRRLSYWKMMRMQRHCPFYLKICWAVEDIPPSIVSSAWVKKQVASMGKYNFALYFVNKCKYTWEKSTVRRNLLETIQNSAQEMRQVNSVLCFGLGAINVGEVVPKWGYLQRCFRHLAAADIARTLAQAQTSTVRVFAQDPLYTDTCKAILANSGNFNIPITVVDYASAEGLGLVNENTFVVSLNATASIPEASIQIAGPTGPAGMLIHPWLENVEQTWNGKIHHGPLPAPYLWGTVAEYDYQAKCGVFKIGDEKLREAFGLCEEELHDLGWVVGRDDKVLGPVHAELLFAKR